MALKPCPECGQSVSERAEICPHCGFKVRAFKVTRLKKRGWEVGFFVFVFLTLGLYLIIANFSLSALLVEAVISLVVTMILTTIVTDIRKKFYNYES